MEFNKLLCIKMYLQTIMQIYSNAYIHMKKNYHHSQITNYKNDSLKCANFIITMKKIKTEFKHVNENNHMVHH